MKLSKWKKDLINTTLYPFDYDGDSDHPECPQCGRTMNFYGHDDEGDFPLGEGYWKCHNCGFRITENELY